MSMATINISNEIYDSQEQQQQLHQHQHQQQLQFVNAYSNSNTNDTLMYLSNFTTATTAITNYINKTQIFQPFNYHQSIATVILNNNNFDSDDSENNSGHYQQHNTVNGNGNFHKISDETTSSANIVQQNVSAMFYNGFRNFSDTEFGGSQPLLVPSSVSTTTNDLSSPSSLLSTINTQTTTTATDDDWIILHWSELLLVCLMCGLIVITVIGNTLVILSVLTTRRLRTVTNCFVMSLAVADWLVGLFVMPPAVAVHLIGSWQLGWILCDIWISLDVLLCTASILSLCAISIDRYLAVTQPLNYSRRRRSKRLALVMILIVWVLALAITCPPILGWYEPGRRSLIECRYNQNEGYVVFSAMGSFFIPMAVMIYVYVRISCVVASRHDHMTEIEVHKKHSKHMDAEIETYPELDPSSEHESHQSPYRKRPAAGSANHPTTTTQSNNVQINTTVIEHTVLPYYTKDTNHHKNGHYELVDTSRPPSVKRSKTKLNNSSSMSLSPAPTSGSAGNTANSSGGSNNLSTWQKCVHQCSMKQHSHQSTTTTVTATSYEHCATKPIRTHHKSLSNRISSLKRENKTTQTLSIVVGGFIVCWLPFFVYYLITPFLPHESVSGNLTNCLTWLGWFNSAMNPFIYAFYSVDFRAAFWRLTFRRFFKNSIKAPYSSNAISIRR